MLKGSSGIRHGRCYGVLKLHVEVLTEDTLCFSFSNCPSFLAAALARATSDEVLQSDLSAHCIPKETDGTEGTVGKHLLHCLFKMSVHLKFPRHIPPTGDYLVLSRSLSRSFFLNISKKRQEEKSTLYI